MYVMFSGTHPFKANNNFDLCNNILSDQISFNGREWKEVSKSAKELIRGMLNKNKIQRPTLEKVMRHKWIKKYTNPKTKKKLISCKAINNLMNFNNERKLEQAL